jgi:hypothetical protein
MMIKAIAPRIFILVIVILLSACKKAPPVQTATGAVTVITSSLDPNLPDFTTNKMNGLWLRPTIEMLPDYKKALLIPYLDGAMVIAELGAQRFKNNDIDGLYDIFSPLWKDQMDINQFKEFMTRLVTTSGEIESLEYRNQTFEYALNTLEGKIDLRKSSSHTYYAMTAEKYPDIELFLDIIVFQTDGQFGITSLQFNTYGDGVPSWLQYPNAPIAPP